MSRKFILPLMFFLSLVLFACSFTNSIPPAALPTNTVSIPAETEANPAQPAATPTPAPSNTPESTPAPSASPTPTSIPGGLAVPYPASSSYIDDRSTPSQVIVSLYNAINRHEYLRAYDYWADPATSLGSFSAYADGYQDTASVDLVFGQITGDAGMSQVYYTIPVILKVTNTDGTHTNYAACYVVHKTQPDVYSAPPVSPMNITRGSAKVSDINASDASVLGTACSGYPIGANVVPISGSTLDISKNNFIDNRSGPTETVNSFLNALNLKQYVRAYSYFQDPATFPGPYGPWAAGYSDTDVITVTFGEIQSEGAAGSLYYMVPLATHVLSTAGTTQNFVGCYTLHLSQPAVQGTPPFQPMGIISGKFKLVDNSTDPGTLLPTACN